tara:strand:+ start:47 stop:499 length:453 start_codon:yes stop_codon:yes gene_type:complete
MEFDKGKKLYTALAIVSVLALVLSIFTLGALSNDNEVEKITTSQVMYLTSDDSGDVELPELSQSLSGQKKSQIPTTTNNINIEINYPTPYSYYPHKKYYYPYNYYSDYSYKPYYPSSVQYYNGYYPYYKHKFYSVSSFGGYSIHNSYGYY